MDDEKFLATLNQTLCEQAANDGMEKIFECNMKLLDNQLKTFIENDPNRENLLEFVDCKKALNFAQLFDPDEFIEQRFQYFGSGSFGNAILMYRGRRYTEKMIKAILCLPEKLAANIYSSAMSYGDVCKEVVCLKILSKLSSGVTLTENQSIIESDHEFGDRLIARGRSHSNGDDSNGPEPLVESKRPSKRYLFKTNCFPILYKIYLCHNETKSLINFESIMPSLDESRLPWNNVLETIIIVMEHCGTQLRELMNQTIILPLALISIFKQIVIGLAIAESIYNFEHRDLHVDNIICKETKSRWVKFVYKSKKYRILSMGFEAKIIDFGYSRISYGGKIYYKNLDTLDYGTDPDDPYNTMAKLFKPDDRWSDYSNQTNFIWMKNLVKKLLEFIDICYQDNQTAAVRQEVPVTKKYFKSIQTIMENCVDIFQLFNQLIRNDFNHLVPFRCY